MEPVRCYVPAKAGLKKFTGLPDVFTFSIKESLGNLLHLSIQSGAVVQIFQPLNHATGVALNQHFSDFAVPVIAY